MTINLLKGDCLELMKTIPDGSVDLVLTDPPYGMMKNAGLDGYKKENEKLLWDNILNYEEISNEIERILRPKGRCILFAQGEFSNTLMNKIKIPFSYKAIWLKNKHANALLSKKAMVSYFEEILIFQKKEYFNYMTPTRQYLLEEKEKAELNGKIKWKEILGNNMGGHYFTNGKQYVLPSKENYKKLQTTGYFQKPFDELKRSETQFESTFNLWEGNKIKKNVLMYAKDTTHYHPTQKPVLLLEDLIKTFTNEGETVLDFTMGSGSTGVACVNTNRDFIGIELDENYFDIASKRIQEAKENKND